MLKTWKWQIVHFLLRDRQVTDCEHFYLVYLEGNFLGEFPLVWLFNHSVLFDFSLFPRFCVMQFCYLEIHLCMVVMPRDKNSEGSFPPCDCSRDPHFRAYDKNHNGWMSLLTPLWISGAWLNRVATRPRCLDTAQMMLLEISNLTKPITHRGYSGLVRARWGPHYPWTLPWG